MDDGETLIRRIWLRFLCLWDYEPSEPGEYEKRPLGKAFILLASGALLSAGLARRFGGLCDQTPMYITILIPCAALIVSLMLVKRGRILIPIFLIGIGSIFLVFKIATSAKASLGPAGLNSSVGLSRGLVSKIETYSATDTEYYSGSFRGWRVYFRYVVDGVTYDQCDILSDSYMKKSVIKVGDDFKVLYLTTRPQIARLLKADETLPDGQSE